MVVVSWEEQEGKEPRKGTPRTEKESICCGALRDSVPGFFRIISMAIFIMAGSCIACIGSLPAIIRRISAMESASMPISSQEGMSEGAVSESRLKSKEEEEQEKEEEKEKE